MIQVIALKYSCVIACFKYEKNKVQLTNPILTQESSRQKLILFKPP